MGKSRKLVFSLFISCNLLSFSSLFNLQSIVNKSTTPPPMVQRNLPLNYEQEFNKMSETKKKDPLRTFVKWILGIDFLIALAMGISSAISAHTIAVLAGTPEGQAWFLGVTGAVWTFFITFIVAGVFLFIFGALGIYLLAWLLGVNPKKDSSNTKK